MKNNIISLKKIIILNFIISLFASLPAKAEEISLSKAPETKVIKSGISSIRSVQDDSKIKRSTWEILKGKPDDDSVMLLMYSYHTRGDRDELNQKNKLVAADYKGYSIGTFDNSYRVRTYYVGLSRKVAEKVLGKDLKLDLKYKAVALYGYRDFEPDVLGITPTIIPMIGITKGRFGVDFLLSMGKTPTFATNFRINLN